MKIFTFYTYRNGKVNGFSTCAEDYYVAKNRAKEFGTIVISYSEFINIKRTKPLENAEEAYQAYLKEETQF